MTIRKDLGISHEVAFQGHIELELFTAFQCLWQKDREAAFPILLNGAQLDTAAAHGRESQLFFEPLTFVLTKSLTNAERDCAHVWPHRLRFNSRVQTKTFTVLTQVDIHTIMLDIELIVCIGILDRSALVVFTRVERQPNFRIVDIGVVGPDESFLTGVNSEVRDRDAILMIEKHRKPAALTAVKAREEKSGFLEVYHRDRKPRSEIGASLAQCAFVHFASKFLSTVIYSATGRRRWAKLTRRI